MEAPRPRFGIDFGSDFTGRFEERAIDCSGEINFVLLSQNKLLETKNKVTPPARHPVPLQKLVFFHFGHFDTPYSAVSWRAQKPLSVLHWWLQ